MTFRPLTVLVPLQASALYETIEAAESIDESGLPDSAYVVPEGTVGASAPLHPNAGSAGGEAAGSGAGDRGATSPSAPAGSPGASATGRDSRSEQLFDATGA